jgi:intraflagellar transport protein 172
MQWVPNTDVLVAQSGKKLYVWYDVETFQNPKTIPINGNVEDVQKNRGKYEVYINYDITSSSTTTTTNFNNNFNNSSNSFSPDNTNNTGLTRIFLDENLINISSAIEERELHKALTILDTVTPSNETTIYWKALAKRAIEARNLYIAQRSFASLGDYSKVAYIKRIIKEKEKNADNPLVEAKILILEKRFREAEELLVKNSMINEIIELYKESLKYEDAIRLTKEFKVDEYETMKNDYLKWLIQNEAYDKAADMKIKDNQLIEAIKLLIEGDLPVKAAELIMSRKMDVEKNTLDYLINVIKGIRLIDKANELAVYASQVLN